MYIYFDLDNTLIDELGQTVRPGMFELLDSFKANNVSMAIWTASVRKRSKPILDNLNLSHYFSDVVYRDDYDPEATFGSSSPKRIDALGGDILVDDSQFQCDYVNSVGKIGFKVTPFFSYVDNDLEELEELHKLVLPDVPFSIKRQSWLAKKMNKIFKKKPLLV